MKCKRETDGRKNDSATQEYIKIHVVKAMRSGRKAKDVSEIFGISVRHVYRVMETFFKGGVNALRTGKSTGRPGKLSADQIRWVAKAIHDDTPYQHKFPFALWTLRTVQKLILDHLEVTLSISATRQLLCGLGFTPQKPRFMAWQQDEILVQKWHVETFPAIQAAAKAAGASLYFGDEAGIRSTDRMGRTWARMGQTPILENTGARFGINMISAVGTRGECEFMVHDGTVNAEVFLTFLKRLMVGKVRPVFLVLDGHRIHHAKMVMEYVDSLKGQLCLFYLPPYSPQLNPDEQVWAHVKREVSAKLAMSKVQLIGFAIAAIERIKAAPELIKSFFRHPECAWVDLPC